MIMLYITTKGSELAAKTLQSKTLQFSKFAIGSGTLENSNVETIKALSNLLNVISTFSITDISRTNDTQVKIKGLFKNTDIEQDFFLRELGLYAIDPDTQEEVLFAYKNYGNEAEYIDTAVEEKKEYYYNVIIKVDNANNVEISIDKNTVYVTQKEFEQSNRIDTATIPLPANTVISNGGTLTLPLKYQVGNGSLELFFNTEKMIKATGTEDGHYTEVGEAGALSNTIAFHRTEDDGNWTLEEDELITVVVRGVAQEVSENG